VTRWHLINLPVYSPGARRPFAAVTGAWFDWEALRLKTLVLGRGVRGWRTVRAEAALIRDDAVVVTDLRAIERVPRRLYRLYQTEDWEGRPVQDADRRPVGRIRDVEFDPASGRILTVWVSRGVLADIWQGMVAVDARALAPSPEGITVVPVGHAPS
jgi:uncharacterized protein YrrD